MNDPAPVPGPSVWQGQLVAALFGIQAMLDEHRADLITENTDGAYALLYERTIQDTGYIATHIPIPVVPIPMGGPGHE